MVSSLYFLSGAFKLEDGIRNVDSCIIRPNLVVPPSMLKYYRVSSVIDGVPVYYFVNTMNVCIFIAEYNGFASEEEMMAHYRSEQYQPLYLGIIKQANTLFNTSLTDAEWTMPIVTGKNSVDYSITRTESIDFILGKTDEYNLESVQMLDAMMISESISVIGSFFKQLTTRKELSKFERYQVSYYVQELNLIKEPDFYLTNGKEIESMKKYYEIWLLYSQIETSLSIAEQSIRLFDFMANNTKNIKSDIASLLMSSLSLILLYEPINNLMMYIFPNINVNIMSFIMKMLIGACTVSVLILLVKIVVGSVKENLDFRRRTK